ncbi:MAG: hypothetical protein ACF8PN_07140 [Phycisphaerales bacterium]
MVISMIGPATLETPPYARDGKLCAMALIPLQSADGHAVTANGIGSDGRVVGNLHRAEVPEYPAYQWSSGVFQLLAESPDTLLAEGFSVNGQGVICGTDGPAPFATRAAVWRSSGQSIQHLGTLGGTDSWAFDLNESEQIVGWSEIEVGSGDRQAILWNDSGYTILGDLGFPHSEAYAINESGEVVGMSWTAELDSRAFHWQAGVMTDLGTLGGSHSWAYDINDNGWIAGRASTGTSTPGVIWIDGVAQVLPGHDARPVAINNLGDVVGASWTRSGRKGLAVWIDFELHNLEECVAPNHRWNFDSDLWSWVDDINDNRQIVGRMPNVDQTRSNAQGFIMSPVTWTASLELVGGAPGVAGGVNTLTADGFTPGARVYFVYSRHGGGAMIPGCSLLDNALQIDDPQIAGRATADTNGVATLTAFVPAAAASLGEIVIQAVDPTTCEISDWIAVRFE